MSEPQLSKESEKAHRTLSRTRQTIESEIAKIEQEFVGDNVDGEFISELISVVYASIQQFCKDEKANYDDEFPLLFTTGFDLIKSITKLKLKVKNFLNVPVNKSSITTKVKLPEIILQTFDGDYLELFSFRERFNSLISDNVELSTLEKFQYLKSSLKGEAARTIQSLEISESNYSVALQLLRDTFENKRLIINTHLQALFNLPQIKKESCHDYREFISIINQNTHALESLQCPVNASDMWLVYFVLNRCPESLRLEWDNQLSSSEIPDLKQLIAFLTKRQKSLQSMNSSSVFEKPNYSNSNNSVTCYLCSQPHLLFNCQKFRALDVTKRLDLVRSKKLCKNCLKFGHNVIDCKSTRGCKTCNKQHNTLLHFTNQNQAGPSNSLYINNTDAGTVLLATAIVNVKVDNKFHKIRALLDPGSQINLITNNVVNKLKLNRVKTNQTFSAAGNSNFKTNSYVDVNISSLVSNFKSEMQCFTIDRITNQLPAKHLNTNQIQLPSDIRLADQNFHVPANVDLLIGVELYNALLKVERIQVNKLLIQNTELGWVISGRLIKNQNEPELSCNSITLNQINSNIRRFWEIENVDSGEKFQSREEIDCEKHFNSTYSRKINGRFVVALPFKSETFTLGSTYCSAKKRLFNLEQKFERNSELKSEYISFMREYIQLGHMCQVKLSAENIGYFLPHHAVIKKSSITTKLRVVFDASAKSYNNNTSLNDLLLTGPTLQDDLFNILIRFRTHQYVITADIKMMYRQIEICESDRKYQQILWRESPREPIKTYQLNTVTYGTCCAPYLAVRCLQELAKEAPDSLTSSTIINDFYMDDVLTGASTIQGARQLRDSLMTTLSKGGFKLRKWASNNENIINDLNNADVGNHILNLASNEQIKALGVQWNPINDTIQYNSFHFKSVGVTKRIILSEISKYFDPLGLLGPVTVRAKLILQNVWKLNLKWDQRVPENILISWSQLKHELESMQIIETQRKMITSPNAVIEIHAFGDASLVAYGASIYVKSLNPDGTVSSRILCAKSRIAPLKTITLPRLELCAAVLTANLCNQVKKALNNQVIKCYYYTDSTIVLSWLKSEACRFKQFIAHRIGEIQCLSNINNWFHIRSEQNPADLISRGCLPSQLINNQLWWNGPDFLKQDITPQVFVPKFNKDAEFRVLVVTESESMLEMSWLNNYSSWIKLIRVTAWIKRFVYNSVKSNYKLKGELSVEELNTAEMLIIKHVQDSSFHKEKILIRKNKIVNNIGQLNPFIDDKEIMRVGGRLRYSKLAYDSKFPIILPKSHRITDLIIRYYHCKYLHIGPQGTLAAIRSKFWPIAGKSTVKRTIRECLICFKANPRSSEPIMGNLPAYRSDNLRPFLKTGLDYGGSFMIKEGQRKNAKFIKTYIALFVCMATKAIHLEIVRDLTTESFLAALRRFISRRGMVTDLFSDNATTFKGANNELKQLYEFLLNQQSEIKVRLGSEGINWHFIPPRAPHFGGLWEAGIKSTKRILYKVTGGASLMYDECFTLLTQIEAILNSRPLTPLSNDPNDLSFLTPGHFLIGESLRAIPEPSLEEVQIGRLSRWQLIQRMQQQFWTRWQKEYLQELQARRNWKRSAGELIEVGQMVLIHEDNMPPCHWRLGRVESIHPGKDGVVRAASVKTKNDCVVRPTVKLFALPLRYD